MGKAAENGRKVSQETLGFIYAGTLYTNRNLLPCNYTAALTWLRKAGAENCSMRAKFTLGQLYYEGQGIVRDYGEANAQVKLAGMYYKGEGVVKDRVQAFMWIILP